MWPFASSASGLIEVSGGVGPGPEAGISPLTAEARVMGIRSLMSAAEAAGYAMAPSEETEMPSAEIVAATDVKAVPGRLALPAPAKDEPLLGSWLRDALFNWWPGRAAA